MNQVGRLLKIWCTQSAPSRCSDTAEPPNQSQWRTCSCREAQGLTIFKQVVQELHVKSQHILHMAFSGSICLVTDRVPALWDAVSEDGDVCRRRFESTRWSQW